MLRNVCQIALTAALLVRNILIPLDLDVRYKPEHFELANFIKKRLKGAYSPEDMAYEDTDQVRGLVATQ